jgi:hypothetical protein
MQFEESATRPDLHLPHELTELEMEAEMTSEMRVYYRRSAEPGREHR